jgi:hypothetical protein
LLGKNTLHDVLLIYCKNSRSVYPQFKSAPPQLRNIADNHIDSELRTKKSCGIAIADLQKYDFRNSCQFRYFLVPFS